jgi:hypothetical protein
MFRMTRSHTLVATAALMFAMALPAAHAAGPMSTRAVAHAFVQDLATGHYARAEACFTPRMRRLAKPAKLRSLWQFLGRKFGAYEKIDGSDAVTVAGHPTIIVHTAFTRLTVGLEITFDAAHRIAGLHVVPVQPAP